jgi:hypothetical protein
VVGLYRATLGSSDEPEPAPVSGSPKLFGPVATDTLTLISKPSAGQSLTLFAVAR